MANKQKGSKKYGRNKESCKLYHSMMRLEKNKRRKQARHQRAIERKAEKMAKRILSKKPVPKGWIGKLVDSGRIPVQFA